MADERGAFGLKKLFGRKNTESPAAEAATAQAGKGQTDKVQTVQRPEGEAYPNREDFQFLAPMNGAVHKVWKKCGGQGPLVLSLFPDAPPKVPFDQAAVRLERSALLDALEQMCQAWLETEEQAEQKRKELLERATEMLNAKTGPSSGGDAAGDGEPDGGKDAQEERTEGEKDQAENAPDDGADQAPEERGPVVLPPLDLDEQCIVRMALSGLTAWLFLLPPSGQGRCLTQEDGLAAISGAKITVGLDEEAIAAAFGETRPYFQLCPVAWGAPATEGKDGEVVDHFKRKFVREVEANEGDQVDYRALSHVQAVEKDAVICEFLPPVEGAPGIQVDGFPILPKPVKPAVPPVGLNTALSEDKTQLLAMKDGLLEFSANCFQVKELLNIQSDVDYSTGNIDFKGDVYVHGNVREQFSVRATGSVQVDGTVEAATIEAGGDVLISVGVSGNGQAVIRGKLVRARYLESCTVYAQQVESDYIMASRVFSEDSVCASGGHGAIISGQVVAANMVKATTIGSASGRYTEVSLGGQPKLREELYQNKDAILALKNEQMELEKKANFFSKRKDMRNSEAVIADIRCQQEALAAKERELQERQTELLTELSSLSNCRLESGTVYAGVKITIGSAVKTVEHDINHCVAVFDPEERDIKFL